MSSSGNNTWHRIHFDVDEKAALYIYSDEECIRIVVDGIKTVHTRSTLIIDSRSVKSVYLRQSFPNSWSADHQCSAKNFK
jgi:hypothetical protein